MIKWVALFAFPVMFAIVLILTGGWIRTAELEHIQSKAGDALSVYTGDLQIELEKFEALPHILSKNPLFLQLIEKPDDSVTLDLVNRELERINSLARTSAVYILDRKGHALASSNWNEEVSFIGEDLSFRPYFQQAIRGEAGRYFALGITSNVRGYYFSAPINIGGEVEGVLTVKVRLHRLEENWARGFEKVVVTDPYGVIFISSYRPWRFLTLEPLSDESLQSLQKSLRYGKISPKTLSNNPVFTEKNGLRFISLKKDAVPESIVRPSAKRNGLYLIRSCEMPVAGWTVHILSDISHVQGLVRNMVLLLAFLLVIFCLSGALWYNKRRARLTQKELEATSRKALQDLNEQLEQRVVDRTKELTRINDHLSSEVKERRRTENELRATQEELIQAGKLAAIGHMATSITHEISQPLAAMRMFAENSLVLLDQKQPEEVRINLQDISDLVIKMSRIISHLKSFARKSNAALGPVDLELAVNNVLVLLAMELKKTGTEFHNTIENDVFVLADQGRLEQVLMNVLSNAIDAVTGQSRKFIIIAAEIQADVVELSVRDSGPGIAESDLENIFEPFFTGKPQGDGLGLGLSLSRSIIKDFGGRMSAQNYNGQGAVFTITLQRTAAVQEYTV
jgi:two-component system C4-dicarboxylate transport sensor histidine kinase DctB